MSQWNFGRSSDIEKERVQVAAFESAMAALIETCAPVARLGDGNCGHIIETLRERLANAGLYTSQPMARSASKKVPISAAIRTAVFERDRYRCLRCGTQKALRADHVVPESKGGKAEERNLQTLCQPCNSWKGTKTIDFRGMAQ